jgi:ATP-binding cassette subfamily C protein
VRESPGSGTIATIFGTVTKNRSLLLSISLHSLVAALVSTATPLPVPLLLDALYGERDYPLVVELVDRYGYGVPIVLVALFSMILRLILFYTSRKYTHESNRLSSESAYRLRKRVIDTLRRMTMQEYEKLERGGTVNRTFSDISNISSFVNNAVSTLPVSILQIVGSLVVLLFIDPLLTLFVFALNPVMLAMAIFLGRRASGYYRRQQEAYESFHGYMSELLDMFVQLRVGSAEKRFFGILDDRAMDIEKRAVEYSRISSNSSALSSLVSGYASDILRLSAVAVASMGGMSLGEMLAFIFYISFIVSPVQRVVLLLLHYRSIRPSVERLDELLGVDMEEDGREGIYDPFDGKDTVSVTMRNVSFSYGERRVLKSIDIEVGTGERVAVIGRSGSGKSTIAKIMAGLYEPETGEVLYGGVSSVEISRSAVRNSVALVLQETLFFDDTIRMNLTLGRDIDDARIEEALHMVAMDEFVFSLKDGLESGMGKNGIRLSGGERQRLAMARVILSEPKAVIFDESTSSLDIRTEKRLFERMESFFAGRTIVYISHKIATIRQAERIYIVEDGEIKAMGSYDELLSLSLLVDDFDDER